MGASNKVIISRQQITLGLQILSSCVTSRVLSKDVVSLLQENQHTTRWRRYHRVLRGQDYEGSILTILINTPNYQPIHERMAVVMTDGKTQALAFRHWVNREGNTHKTPIEGLFLHARGQMPQGKRSPQYHRGLVPQGCERQVTQVPANRCFPYQMLHKHQHETISTTTSRSMTISTTT